MVSILLTYKTTASNTIESATRIYLILKNVYLAMKYLKFSGENPIIIFDFLICLVEGAEVLDMKEG